MTAPESFETLLRPVFVWLQRGGDAEQVDLAYWDARRRLMKNGESFGGPGAEWLSNIDAAMDAYSTDPDPAPFEIDEQQLRREVQAAVDQLIRAGHFKP